MDFLLLRKFFMNRIETSEKLIEVARKIIHNNLTYRIYDSMDDFIFEVYKGKQKVYEFVSKKDKAQIFLDEAVQF